MKSDYNIRLQKKYPYGILSARRHRKIKYTTFLCGKNILHMIYLATHFCSSSFLNRQSSGEIWLTIQNQWFFAYNGPHDFLTVDQGSDYVSKDMRSNLSTSKAQLREGPVDNYGSIGTFECYKDPLRAVLEKGRE